MKHLVHRLRCAIGLHRPVFWYVPTGHWNRDPLYRPAIQCVWCAKEYPR